MSKNLLNNNINNINDNTNRNSTSNNKSDNNHYNVIINQNSTYNQDNSINIMLDTGFPYFQNYNYQQNETEANKNNNQIIPVLFDQKQMIEQNDNNKEKIINEKDSNEKIGTPPKKKHKKKNINSPKNKKSNDQEQENVNSTNKIDYRYVKKCPIKEIISPYSNEVNQVNKETELFWFATYDKLMKTKYLIKIFNYYNNKPFEPHSDLNYNFKEKTLVIKDFEIYFYENSNRPFIHYAKGGTIYTKLYLLTLKQINQIFSYLNRIEYKINYDRLNYLQRKGTFEIINDNTNEVVLPYCLIYCLGKYMNINIYGFSNNIDYNIYSEETSFQKNQRISSYTVLNHESIKKHNYILSNDKRDTIKLDNTNINRENFKLPNSKKIAKLIKIINLNYPDFSIDDIINYLIPDNKYINSITKINEIKNIFFFKKSNQNKIILSSMVRDTIKGISIQTPKSLISSFCPAESIIENTSFKNSDLFQPVSKKYVIPIKDDYKFQTINTNEKDNNKNNPFIIYVCDNVQKINFTNDPQANNINNINNINNNIYNPNAQYMNPQQNNKSIETYSNNYKDDMTYFETDINQQGKKFSRLNKNNKNNNNYKNNSQSNAKKSIQNQNYSDLNNINNNNNIKKLNKKMVDRTKIKSNKLENDSKIDNNNMVSPGKPSGIKIQKISTDINTIRKKTKYDGVKRSENKIRESYKISRTNIPLGNLNNTIKHLNKSIENPNEYLKQLRLNKTSDMKKRQNCKSNNKTKLINRINLNKKENPFFKNNNYNTNL